MNNYRRHQANSKRERAAQLAADRPHPAHHANGDEQRYRFDQGDHKAKPNYIASYTKGLPHNHATGLVSDPDHFQKFVRGIDSGDPRDFQDTPLGHPENRRGWSFEETCLEYGNPWKSHKAKSLPKGKDKGKTASLRAWESAAAGNTYDLEGPDAQAVTMPPAPALASKELAAEMGECYAQALLRDVPFDAMALGTAPAQSDQDRVNDIVGQVSQLEWFEKEAHTLPDEERARHRSNLMAHTAFRGQTAGDLVGPYISQFLLAGHGSINGIDEEPSRSPADGIISYGAQAINQRVRYATPWLDYMTSWDEWYDVQLGADLRGLESYEDNPPRRFITTPRDLATYVHYDALYQAYLNACLLMLGAGIPFDPGIPYQGKDVVDHQQGFAHFGGPHILSLVTEVATRALKAVRFQKFNVHRRARPEVIAARIEKHEILGPAAPPLKHLHSELHESGILSEVEKHNRKNHSKNKKHHDKNSSASRYLLPMAFCEGSPMHPSYGAGHATVAGACVTILKAFFDHCHPLALADADDPGKAFVPDKAGSKLLVCDVKAPTKTDAGVGESATLTVEGELNKLASNISIGRNWAGVHYYTDYIESIRMGEAIAIGILEEQKLTYNENFSMTIPLFDGGVLRI